MHSFVIYVITLSNPIMNYICNYALASPNLSIISYTNKDIEIYAGAMPFPSIQLIPA